jgi:hypothetical protein
LFWEALELPIDRRAGEKVKVAAVLCSFVLLFVLASNSPAQTNWKSDWEKLVKAAREEGRLTIYGTTIFEDVFKVFFQKAYPEIKLSFVVGRGADIAPRLMQERRAGKYLADIYTGGMHSAYELFYRKDIGSDPARAHPAGGVGRVQMVARQTPVHRSG